MISAWTDCWCRQHYWVRHCQGLSETLRNWKRVYYTCVILALLEIHLNTVYSHPVFALSSSNVSTPIPLQQYRLRIGFRNHFVNANYTSSRLKDQFNMMCGSPITDNYVVLWKVCYNSRSQDVSSHAKIETICCTIKNTWNEIMLWLTQIICYNAFVPLLVKGDEWCGAKSKPYNFWCPSAFDRHSLRITVCMKGTPTPTKRNALKVKRYLKLFASGFQSN